MNDFQSTIRKGVLLLATGWALWPGTARTADAPYWERQEPRPWYTFRRPARDNPADQLAYARSLRERNRPWSAGRHFRALVASWPAAPQASVAQTELADLLAGRHAYADAFDEYQILLDRYPDQVSCSKIADLQFHLAECEMMRKQYRWLFGGWDNPDRAIPLFEKYIAAAPGATNAPRAQLWIGRAHEGSGDDFSASLSYQELLIRYPKSPEAEEAAFRRSAALYRIARESPRHTTAVEEAWFALDAFLRSRPQSAFAAEARNMRDDMRDLRVQNAWRVATYYRKHHASPESVRLSFERFLILFPDSPHTTEAQEVLKSLPQGPPMEENKNVEDHA